MTVNPSSPSGSALRQRMIEDMTVRGFTEKTQHDYIRGVKTFAAFLGRSPDRASAEDLRRFQVVLLRKNGEPLMQQEDLYAPVTEALYAGVSG
jgi:hypothetical protein